jgi:carboxyl-terminal processing protease
LSFIDPGGVRHSMVLTPRVMDPQPAFVADRSRPGVVVLTVEGFEPGLGRWMGEQLAGLPTETDVILDLRGNPGGRLTEAEAVLSCFLPPDRVWATRRPRSGRAVVMSTGAGCGTLVSPTANDVAILVDGQSRSAAELTPAALQEARRALVVGERTAGAVLISQEARLPDGGRLTLSRADFITSGGVRLEKNGVRPDLVASRTAEDRRAGRDPALDAAVAALARPRAEQALAAPAAPL